MSASWLRLLGLMMVSSWLAVGCSGPSKIEVGGTCVLNSDCNQGLVCTWGKCHDGCHTTADCPAGQSCITANDQSKVCQLPVETHCIYDSECQTPLKCAADQRCRNQCQTDVDCPTGQTCTTTKSCAEPNQVDSNKNLFAPDGGFKGSGGASGADAAASCPTGAEGCSCYPNDSCNTGLTCASHLCVSLGTGGSGGDSGCPTGAELCSCYPNDTCNAGLTCASHLCVRFGAGGSGGAGGGGSGADAGKPDAPGAQPDVPIAGAGGAATSAGGTTGSGGAQGTGGSVSSKPDASPDLPPDLSASTGGVTGTGGIPSTGGVTGTGGVADAATDGATGGTWACPAKTPAAGTCNGVDADCDGGGNEGFCGEVLRVHMDGANGSQTFTDSSLSAHALQVAGNVSISTASSRFGGASMHSGGGLENYVYAADSDDWYMAAGDFTMDAWVNIDELPPAGDTYGYAVMSQFADAGNGWALFLMNADYGYNGWAFVENSGWGTAINVSQGILTQTAGVWTHIAVTRQGTTIRLFVNGTAVATVSIFTAVNDFAAPLLIGSDGVIRGFKGYIDEVHIVKGAAVWTSDFTPPTAAY